MQNDSLSLNLQSQYSINELIFINSGSNYYVRLPINQSAALFAGNNEGKTSSLSALKLFLLPEVNFKGSASKFNFSSGGTSFSDIDSFTYYFPSAESYIICEADNPSHPQGFCWILFKGTDYHYDRIAVPHPYNYIEHLFWNSSSPYNENIGALHNDISIKTIKEKLLSKHYGGKLITDKKTIGEAIYSRTNSQDDHTRFCLLPMVQKSSLDSIRTVRSLLDMAFDLSNASTKSLPVAIGSIIDGKGLSVVDDDGIFLNLEEKLDEWEKLQIDQNLLSLIEDKTPQWNDFKENVELYNQKKSNANTLFVHVYNYAGQAVELFAKESKSLQEHAEKQEKALNSENIKLQNIQNDITRLCALVSKTVESITNTENKLTDVQTLKDQYKRQKNLHTTEEVVNELKQQEIDNKTIIQALQNENEAQKKLEELTKKINSNYKQINALKLSLEKVQNRRGFLDQFEMHTSSVLLSLNENFTSLTLQVTHEEKRIISDFTNLFMEDKGQLLLHNELLSSVPFKKYSDIDICLKITKDMDELQLSTTELDMQRSSLHQQTQASPQERQQIISTCITENEIIKAQLINLTGEDSLRQNLKELQDELGIFKNQLAIQEEAKRALKNKLSDLRDQYNRAHSAYDRSQKTLVNLQNLISDLDALSLANRGYLNTNTQTPPTIDLYKTSQYDHEYAAKLIKDIRKNADSINELNTIILQSLRTFIDYNFIEMSPEEKHQVTISSNVFQSCYSTLHNTFETLDVKRTNFYDRLQAHNNTVATSIRIINNTKDFIDTYINNLNRQLEGYQISNLDSVTIKVDFHPQYLAAVSAMNKMSIVYNDTYPKELYDNIQAFQASFYIKQSNKIDIAKIIEKVNYAFFRNGTKEEIPQSNGTNSMINAILLAILFKSMIPEDLKLQLPVVFDEIGKLDEENLNEIYKIVTEQNLVLFVATPDPTGIIASVLDLYHDLSCFQATDIAIHGKAKTIYFQDMEERLINLEES